MPEKTQSKVPVKLFGDHDPILFNRLSLFDMFQWLFFIFLIYVDFNLLPLAFPLKVPLAALILAAGWLFIHTTFNGTSGIVWVLLNFKHSLNKRLGKHKTISAVKNRDLLDGTVFQPRYRVKMTGQAKLEMAPGQPRESPVKPVGTRHHL